MNNKPKLLDTNILIIANGGQSPQVDARCQKECLELLFNAMVPNFPLIVDGGKQPDSSEIFAEYGKKINQGGQSFGKLFFEWLLRNWERHILVPITPANGYGYEEFPHEDDRLEKFDPSDRKFIATARAAILYDEATKVEILQATDGKWKNFETAFKDYGIEVVFICGLASPPTSSAPLPAS
jgi:hypothetical protein